MQHQLEGRPLGAATALVAAPAPEAVRVRREQRLVLPRRQKSGTPRIKQANRPGGMTTQKAEADDLKDGETLAIRRARAREAET